MRAWQYSGYRQEPVLLELPDPVCPADGVVVRVAASGICRSDWHAWSGHDPVSLPQIPGHEFAGTVTEVGGAVTRCKIGQRITAPFVLGCGRCASCRRGDAQVCEHQQQPGFTRPGSFAELIALPGADHNVVQLPDRVGFVAAAALGCRFATAFRALTVHGAVRGGQWVAVHGCGGVGLSAVMIGAALGARVVAVDRSTAALEWAVRLGAVAGVDPADTADVPRTIVELTEGGAHVSIDAVGHPAIAADSVRSLRRRGRHVQVGLLLGADAAAPLPMDQVIAWELQILGSHGMAARDYPRMLALVETGAVDPGRLVGRVIDLEGAGAALVAMDNHAGPGMTVIELTQSGPTRCDPTAGAAPGPGPAQPLEIGRALS